jgi:hypothetical protein
MAEAVHSNSFTTAPAGEIGPLNFEFYDIIRGPTVRAFSGG